MLRNLCVSSTALIFKIETQSKYQAIICKHTILLRLSITEKNLRKMYETEKLNEPEITINCFHLFRQPFELLLFWCSKICFKNIFRLEVFAIKEVLTNYNSNPSFSVNLFHTSNAGRII